MWSTNPESQLLQGPSFLGGGHDVQLRRFKEELS